jgi:hypothetical protein
LPAQLRPDLRAEPVRTGVCTVVQPSALSSNMRTKLRSILQPLRTQHAVLAVLWWLPTAPGVRTEPEPLA